uniref:Secreted protein n=1 Tax=Loa loa TaxID=7209 RepID=A0A1I7W1G9_LOALO
MKRVRHCMCANIRSSADDGREVDVPPEALYVCVCICLFMCAEAGAAGTRTVSIVAVCSGLVVVPLTYAYLSEPSIHHCASRRQLQITTVAAGRAFQAH